MNDLWYGLEERLRATANNKANGGCDGAAIICLNLVYNRDNKLAGWYKPQRVSLEPRTFDISALLAGKKRLGNWQNVINIMKQENPDRRTIEKNLIVLDGLPVGFLDSLD